MAVSISVRADVKALQDKLDAFRITQLPFAAARALTTVAQKVKAAESANIAKVFPTATPFTLNSVRVKAAKKNDPVAVVYIGDIASHYLMPFEAGGTHSLGSKRGLIVPKNVAVNQYGNLTRGKLASLKGKSNVFVGSVTFKKSGQTVSGVWERPPVGTRKDGGRGAKGSAQNRIYGARTGLKLLIRFEDPLPVKQRLGFGVTGRAVVAREFRKEMGAALARAIATSKL